MEDLLWFTGIAACIKLLLAPAYRSTDFEVHRNWLAVTYSLPLSQWYSDATSPWTLDYPPFFAYLERFLSIFAKIIDPKIVDLREGLDYAENTVVYFQRFTVLVADLVLVYGVHRFTRSMDRSKLRMVLSLVLWSPSLLIVDHMHFQYNGFLLGILLISLSFLKEEKDLLGGFTFAMLLCFKHLFAVSAPVYFVYLLRHYCRGRGAFKRFLTMGFVVGLVFIVAFGPFLYHGQIYQVLHRMFPFGRGLCHAYWAPNFWVFYIIIDKVIAICLKRMGFNIHVPSASFTGGLVGNASPFAVLPRVSPLVTFSLVILAIFPCLIKAWKKPQPNQVVRWVAYANTCGFLFGWHVHEKASLHFLIPLSIIAMNCLDDARHYFMLSTVSCYSMFPLLFEAKEYPIKVLLLLIHSILIWFGFSIHFGRAKAQNGKMKLLKRFEIVYLLCLLVVEIYGQFLHPLIFQHKLPFLPVMLLSIYCAFGMMISWIFQLRRIVIDS